MKDELIRDIVELEWEMFQNVQNIGGRASCQDDWNTFEIMRKSQFKAWPQDLLESYLNDVHQASTQGRNLLSEKYAHMMEFTNPLWYAQNASSLPPVSQDARQAAQRIARAMADSQAELAKKYPRLIERGRPVYSKSDSIYGTSLETYLMGELLTYSKKTLDLFEAALLKTDIAHETMLHTVRHYGYASLEDAETKLSARK